MRLKLRWYPRETPPCRWVWVESTRMEAQHWLYWLKFRWYPTETTQCLSLDLVGVDLDRSGRNLIQKSPAQEHARPLVNLVTDAKPNLSLLL